MPRTIKADGKTIVVPDDATDDEINQLVGPAPVAAQKPPAQAGFFENLLPHAVMHPLDAAHERMADIQSHPIRNALESIPGVAAVEGIAGGIKRSGGELIDGGKALIDGNPASAVEHGVRAVPILGPAIDDAANNPKVGGTGSYGGDLKSVITNPGVMGSLLSASAQVAPLVAGGMDMAAPGRPLLGEIPTRAKAGKIFESLNSDLDQTPVPLRNAVDPLQRATEIGVRGSSLPKSVSDLLTRSQSPIDMTFPEARDYQSSLSDLSTSDKLAMNGRMRGGVAQLNKGLFSDIQDAAETAGRGDDYANAMKMYRQAATVNKALKTSGKVAAGAAATAALGGTLAHFLKPLIP